MSKKILGLMIVLSIVLGASTNCLAGSGDTAFSTPTIGPLYGPPPFEYIDNWALSIVFKTEPEVLKELVPEPLEPSPEGIMVMQISRFFVSGFGNYNEMILFTPATYKGKVGNYSVCLMLDNDIAFAAGREIWGFPKKIADVSLEEKDGVITGTVKRGNRVLVKTSMQIGPLGKPSDAAGSATYYNLKLVPSVEKEAPPEVKQLTSTTLENVELKKIYKDRGQSTLEFGESPADPFQNIPVVEVVEGLYVNSDFDLVWGKVIHDYLK
jgi:acetoacetate decarboxylase